MRLLRLLAAPFRAIISWFRARRIGEPDWGQPVGDYPAPLTAEQKRLL